MMKNTDLSSVLKNHSFAIDTEKNIEIMVDFPLKIDEKNMKFYLDSDYKITVNTVGTFLSDFLNTDFESYTEFSEFYVNYGSLISEKKDINNYYNIDMNAFNIFKEVASKVLKKHKAKYIELQKQVDMILDYCLLNPNKDAAKFSPIERLYVLERISPGLTILDENKSLSYKAGIFSSFPGETEKDIYNFLSKKKNNVSELNLLIPNSLSELLYISIFYLLKSNIYFKKCKNCLKYFVTTNSQINYCDRIALNYSKKTCRDIGRQASFVNLKNTDPVLNYYHKVYNRKAMMSYRNPDIDQYNVDFKKFKEQGKKKRMQYINNKLSAEEFEKWIKKND